MRNIGKFEVDGALFIKDIGTWHGILADLQSAGFASEFHLFPRMMTRPAVLIPAEGVALDLLFEALDAGLNGRELPALRIGPWQQ